MRSPLFPLIAAEIAAHGPLTLARFMEIALHDPDHGYYACHPGLAGSGAAGDFVTAPEISQMFGELIGAWAIDLWNGMGAPATFRLIEAGPGRGTMMADLWRVARHAPEFRAAARVTLVERSPALQAVQAQTLGDIRRLQWCQSLGAALDPDAVEAHGEAHGEAQPFIVLANEFLDCLPIRHWRFRGGAPEERCIAVEGDRLVFQWVPTRAGPEVPVPREDAPPTARKADAADDIIETRAADREVVDLLAAAMHQRPGIALVIDYGKALSGPGETLQALAGHRKVDPLADPGRADLTAWVDFAALAGIGTSLGLGVYGPLPQGVFLKRLGIEARAARLATASPARAPAIARALTRLTHAGQMGGLFKVLAFASPGLLGDGPDGTPRAPAGFAP